VRDCTGAGLNADDFCGYLKNKYETLLGVTLDHS
jgi:hypothetical protein